MEKIDHKNALALISAKLTINENERQITGSDFYEYLKGRSAAMRQTPGSINVGTLQHVSQNKQNTREMSRLEQTLKGFIKDFEKKQE